MKQQLLSFGKKRTRADDIVADVFEKKEKKILSPETTLLCTEHSFLKVRQDVTLLPLLDECVKECLPKLKHKPIIILRGKERHQQRDVGFFSNVSKGYKYSGQMMASQPLEANTAQLLNKVNEVYSAKFNGILVNRYNDGQDYISQHADDESALAPTVGVVAISYGATRTLRITNKQTDKKIADFELKHGSWYTMGGNFQREFKHGVPVNKKIKLPRMSFTFRQHQE